MRRWLLTAAVLSGTALARGDTDADLARRSRVVALVGSSRSITVGDLEDRVAGMPPFQRATFGGNPDEIRRRFLNEVLLPDALLSAGAEGARLGDRPPASYALERARSGAVVRAIRERIGPAARIPEEEVRSYYERNRARYETPERILLWRILCRTRDEAQVVLAAAKSDPTPKAFGDLARDHSQDKATYLRAGNLGFLTADGASNEPGLRVDPAIVRAGQAVRDGDIVSAPVAEGEYFSVVWRRGTIAAARHGVDEVAAQVRDTLWKERVKSETDAEVARLRASRLRDLDDSLLAAVDLPAAGAPGTAAQR